MVSHPFKIWKNDEFVTELTVKNVLFSSSNLICGEFKPQITNMPTFIHFNSIIYNQDMVLILPSNVEVQLHGEQNLHIINPGKRITFLFSFYLFIL